MTEHSVAARRAARTRRAFALLGACAIAVACRSGGGAEPSPAAASVRLRQSFERDLDSLGAALDRLDATVDEASAAHDEGSQMAREAFRDSRVAYKKSELLLEPYGPAVVEQLNGPAEVSEEQAYRPLGAPAGFQVLEEALYGRGPGVARDSLHRTVRAMRRAVSALRSQTARLALTDLDVADALRLEIARVSTVGLAGFDTPRSGEAILESAAALDGARAYVPRAWRAVDSALARASGYLRAHRQFDSLDRLHFIVAYANPLARAVADARRTLPGPPPLRRLWRQDAPSVFEANAFDVSALAPIDAPPSSPDLVALGRRLFFEPSLSGPRSRACASCHDPARGFTDGRARSVLIGAPSGPHRNTPTLLGAAYELALFDDQRAGSLEAQAGMVLANPSEMGSSAELAASRLRADAGYREAFARAFGEHPDGTITPHAVRAALAAYVRTLGPLDSRFDQAVRGDTNALSAEERFGFTTFMGKGRCGTCHFAPLFGGTRPPGFVESEAEIIGVPDRAAAKGARVDPDSGLAGSDHQTTHFGAFKVPTLRNVALTAPYMHNGVFRTLDEVVGFYDHGGGAGMGLHVPYQTLSTDSLHLSLRQKRALVAFLRSLTSQRSLVSTATVAAR